MVTNFSSLALCSWANFIILLNLSTLIFKVLIVSSLQNDEVMDRHIIPNAVQELADV